MIWSARVHKSGNQVQLLKNGSVTKVIKASADTFEPCDSRKFAEDLVTTLNQKVAKQMTDPGAKPAVDSKAEVQSKVMDVLNHDAKGISPKEASVILDENKLLKKKVAKLEKDATIERKARRALSIAKELVGQGKVANNESAIKNEVMKIVAMANDEINLLEKRVANTPLYVSVDEAKIAERRYARMSRLHRQAAEDAELAGNTGAADSEDMKAANYEQLSKEAAAEADKYYTQIENATIDSSKPNDIGNQVKKQPSGVDAQGKKASDDNDADDVGGEEIDDEDDDEDDFLEELDDSEFSDQEDDDFEIEAASAIYRKIASNHRKIAEQLTAEGKPEQAVVETEIAKEADELADSIEPKDDQEEYTKEAANIYRRIAADHRKKADDYEAEGKTTEADEEDEIADESEKIAESIESTLDKQAAPEAAAEVAPVKVATDAVPEATMPVDKPIENIDAIGEVADDKDTDKEAKTKCSNDEDDPLAEFLTEDDLKEANVEETQDEGMPTDEEIDAAVGLEPEEEVDVEKDASSGDVKKIANEGYGRSGLSDREEQNSYSNDPQVQDIERMLWQKE
jgi:hypothetical protein